MPQEEKRACMHTSAPRAHCFERVVRKQSDVADGSKDRGPFDQRSSRDENKDQVNRSHSIAVVTDWSYEVGMSYKRSGDQGQDNKV